MEILSESYEPYEDKALNALNDGRIHAEHTFHLNGDTHIIFEWSKDLGEWVLVPMKTFAHSSITLDNLHIIIRIHPPEHMDPQPILRDISDPEYRKMVLNAFEMVKHLDSPACINRLGKALEKAKGKARTFIYNE